MPLWETRMNFVHGVTMAQSAMIHARLEPSLKKEAEIILEKLGLSMTAAMSLFCRQIVLRKDIPFSIEMPKTTAKSMQEARRKATKPGKHKSAATLRNLSFQELCVAKCICKVLSNVA